jgi:hypothetical protein
MPDMNGLKECFPLTTPLREVTGRLWWDFEAGLSREALNHSAGSNA